MLKYPFARFGSAIANIGDIDGNGYNDVAIGAPLEESKGGTSGSIYIYNAFSGGLHQEHSQVISTFLVYCFTCVTHTLPSA